MAGNTRMRVRACVLQKQELLVNITLASSVL